MLRFFFWRVYIIKCGIKLPYYRSSGLEQEQKGYGIEPINEISPLPILTLNSNCRTNNKIHSQFLLHSQDRSPTITKMKDNINMDSIKGVCKV
jgi:hypothetical protein